MSETTSLLVFLGDPRLASYAVGDVPAWLWSADATHMLWGNPVAAAIFNAASPHALTGHTIDPKGSAALQIARLAGSLPYGATPRLERLRGFGGRMGGALMCACSRIVLADRTPAILVVATEASGPRLALDEQAHRLLAGCDAALALFAPDGTLLHATDAGTARLNGATSLAAAGAASAAETAFASGHAEHDDAAGRTALYRIGTGAATLLLATFEPPAVEPAAVSTTAAEAAPDDTSVRAAAPSAAEPLPVPETPSETADAAIAEPALFADLPMAPDAAAPANQPVESSAPDVAEAPATASFEATAEASPAVSTAAAAPEPPQNADSAAAPADAQRAALQALIERRQPLRFVWQMDAEGHFTLASEEFAALIGPRTAAVLGQTWDHIAKTLGLDPEGQVARAFASHNTWSGITVSFPIDGAAIRVPVELSGLPVFDRDRNFRGYRGFGICRAVARIAELALATARPAPAEPPAAPPEPPVFREEPAEPAEPATPSPSAVNVVPFRAPQPASPPEPENDAPSLTPVERHAFTELASRLTARLRSSKDGTDKNEALAPEPAADAATERLPEPARGDHDVAAAAPTDQRPILDSLPIGVLVYRLDQLIYANRAFLDWTGYRDLHALQEAGGLDALFVEPAGDDAGGESAAQSLTIATNRGDKLPVEARLFSSPWEGESALVLMLTGITALARSPEEPATAPVAPVAPVLAETPAAATAVAPTPDAAAVAPAAETPQPPEQAIADAAPLSEVNAERQKTLEKALRTARMELRDTRAMLDLAADGVLVIDRDANVLWLNRRAQALFGYRRTDLIGLPFATLFAEESQDVALETLKNSTAAKLRGRDVIGRRREGGLLPLFMTGAPIKEGDDRVCAIFRDMTSWKKTEGELVNAKRQAERASSAKSDFLAKISHEIRTPLNAIIGFAEVMMQERFGPVGNDRYQQYLKDIHTSGDHLLSLLNDLLDLSKIEAGKLDLNFTEIDLNEVIQQSVALVQPQANRERIIIRTALGTTVPSVTADARSVRQILLNLLSNSIKFTGAGGQVIVSTALGDDNNVVLRVRDTGIGMSEQDIAVALEPFRQLATAGRFGSGGTGLGLPLTKALAEANRASFTIKSAVNTGTLIEVAFPPPRMAAE